MTRLWPVLFSLVATSSPALGRVRIDQERVVELFDVNEGVDNIEGVYDIVGIDGDDIEMNHLPSRKLQGTPSCPSELTDSVSITYALTFYYAVVLSPTNPSRSILCARLESDNTGWLAFGISPNNGNMIGSLAVIGLPSDNSVEKYSMDGKSTYLIDNLPWRQQTLMDESIVQQDGKTILSFTKYLQEEGEEDFDILANGENVFLYAEGADNTWQYHGNRRGVFRLDFGMEEATTTSTTTSSTTTALTTTTSTTSTTTASTASTSSTSTTTNMTTTTTPEQTTITTTTSKTPTTTTSGEIDTTTSASTTGSTMSSTTGATLESATTTTTATTSTNEEFMGESPTFSPVTNGADNPPTVSPSISTQPTVQRPTVTSPSSPASASGWSFGIPLFFISLSIFVTL